MLYYDMPVQAVEKYKDCFFDEVADNRKDWWFAKHALQQIEEGAINLREKRARIIALPSNTPTLNYLERSLRSTLFPLMSMDALSVQCFHYSPGSGLAFFGDVESYSPKFVAARALVLMSRYNNTKQILNIFMPERENRVCLEAMNMLRADFKPNKILEVRLPWRTLSSSESTH